MFLIGSRADCKKYVTRRSKRPFLYFYLFIYLFIYYEIVHIVHTTTTHKTENIQIIILLRMNIIMVALSHNCIAAAGPSQVTRCQTSQERIITATEAARVHSTVQYSHSMWNYDLNRKVFSSRLKAIIEDMFCQFWTNGGREFRLLRQILEAHGCTSAGCDGATQRRRLLTRNVRSVYDD